MILFVVFGVIVIFGVLEILSLKFSEKAVHTHIETDLSLCAPDEEITLKYSITNSSFLPFIYVGISIYFGEGVKVYPPEKDGQKWKLLNDFSGLHVEQRMHLLPHGKRTGRVRFSIKNRGVFTVGQHYVEEGDYLGIKTAVRTEYGASRIICTAKAWEDEPEFRPLGGLLGDVSVMRFIHEDPCLIVGYRDYTGREPMKQISWYQSAKTGRLTVKQQDHTAQADVAVLLNMEGGNRQALEQCLSLTRSVCEKLEAQKIPYIFRSNGDLWDVAEGVGRSHLFPILRSIGLSRLSCYTPFSALADRCIREGNSNRTYIIISDAEISAAINKLQSYSEHRVILLNVKAGDKA